MWQPPLNPDPSAILDEAIADGRGGQPQTALAKFLWFHNNATRYERGLSAVRLSFALSYWLDLAAHYKPALDAIIYTRDETEAAFRENPTDFQLFHDLASLNARLDAGDRTARLFMEIAAENPDAAAHLYRVAESHLIEIGELGACAPFLDPDERLALAAECYELSCEFEDSCAEREPPIPRSARREYVRDVATLAALLVLNGRLEDANGVYAKSLSVVDDEDFRMTMLADSVRWEEQSIRCVKAGNAAIISH